MLLVLNNSVTNEIKLLRYKTVAKKEREDHMKKNQFRQSICFTLLCGCMMFAGAGEARADYEDLTGPEMESGAYVDVYKRQADGQSRTGSFRLPAGLQYRLPSWHGLQPLLLIR